MSFPQFLKLFKQIEPLTNFQILDICKQLSISNFKGVYMRDEIKGRPEKDECFIMNIDHSNNPGTHWTSLFVKRGVCRYFDSYGFPPPVEIVRYCDGLDLRYSSSKIQRVGEVLCGHYSIYTLYLLHRGVGFLQVLGKLMEYSN